LTAEDRNADKKSGQHNLRFKKNTFKKFDIECEIKSIPGEEMKKSSPLQMLMSIDNGPTERQES